MQFKRECKEYLLGYQASASIGVGDVVIVAADRWVVPLFVNFSGILSLLFICIHLYVWLFMMENYFYLCQYFTRGEDLGVVVKLIPVDEFYKHRKHPHGEEDDKHKNQDSKISSMEAWSPGFIRAPGRLHRCCCFPVLCFCLLSFIYPSMWIRQCICCLFCVHRLATPAEIAMLSKKLQDEVEIVQHCNTLISTVFHLDMSVTDAEYQFDRHKLTLFYVSGQPRVDFRELVKEIYANYKVSVMYVVCYVQE